MLYAANIFRRLRGGHWFKDDCATCLGLAYADDAEGDGDEARRRRFFSAELDETSAIVAIVKGVRGKVCPSCVAPVHCTTVNLTRDFERSTLGRSSLARDLDHCRASRMARRSALQRERLGVPGEILAISVTEKGDASSMPSHPAGSSL